MKTRVPLLAGLVALIALFLLTSCATEPDAPTSITAPSGSTYPSTYKSPASAYYDGKH